MKQFIIKIILFFLILFPVFFIVGRDYRTVVKSDFMAAIIDKHALLENTHPPRILLCGGSNLAFGIDSKRIQDTFGLPVINLGLHAGLGVEFMINEIKLSTKPTDIVIFSFEYLLDPKGDYISLN